MENAENLQANGTSLEGTAVERVLLPVLEVLITMTGLLGHSLVVVILMGRRRQRRGGGAHGTDTLLLALSGADLLLLVCLPFHTAAAALGRWPFGTVLCKAVSFLGTACSCASAFTLAALAVSRYLTVVRPTSALRARAHRHLWLLAGTLWLPAVALAAPQFAFRAMDPSSQLYCFAFLSDISQLVYSIAFFLMAFALPLAVIILMYSRIYWFLRARRRTGLAPQLERYQNQVTRTSGLLVIAFTLCWLPSYVLMFSLLGRGLHHAPRNGPLAIVARLLAISSTVANPILYVFMSHKFRSDLLRVCRGASCRGGPSRGCCCPGRSADTGKHNDPVELSPPPQTKGGSGREASGKHPPEAAVDTQTERRGQTKP
nr:galanin receptor type 1-like [Paramormyrops kingsleyae]